MKINDKRLDSAISPFFIQAVKGYNEILKNYKNEVFDFYINSIGLIKKGKTSEDLKGKKQVLSEMMDEGIRFFNNLKKKIDKI